MTTTNTVPGEQRRVGAVAGEVLACRDLEAAERAEDDAEAERGRAAADQPDHQQDDPGEDRQLGEGEFAPRRRRALVRSAWVSRSCQGFRARSTAASRPDNGHPEETLTRHQPISIPSGPRRGSECQCPQPGSPMSARDIRSQRCFSGAASIPPAARGSRSRARPAAREPASAFGNLVGEGVANRLELSEAQGPRLAGDGGHADVDPKAGEGLGDDRGQLPLQASDLAPQLGASEKLVSRRKEAQPGYLDKADPA